MRHILSFSDEEASAIAKANPVIFLGSAISTFSPTNLPSGELFCKIFYNYISALEESNILLKSEIIKEIANVPFEAIMECCPIIESMPAKLSKIFRISAHNNVHDSFAFLLSKNAISSIITPNYDLALDEILQTHNFSNIIRTKDDYSKYINSPDNRTYFKIHGTAEENYEETIIFTLNQEGALPEWKKELLKKIIQGKILIFIGYSGRDFDICPLIADLGNYQKILWIKFDDENQKWKEQTAYEEYLLSKKESNEPILGRFESVLSRLFKLEISSSYNNIVLSFEKEFSLSDEMKIKWMLNILSRIACATEGKKLLQLFGNKLNDAYKLKLHCDMYGHTGEYRKAFQHALLLSKLFPIETRESISALNMMSRFNLYYGNYFTAYLLLKTIKIRRNKYFNNDKTIEAAIAENEITFWHRMKQLISNKILRKVFFFLHYLIDKKIMKVEKRFEVLKESGSWDERQMIQHNLERLGKEKDFQLALPAYKGYKNLGLPGMEIISCRHRILKNPWDNRSEELLDYCINKAKLLGMTTELWKLYRLKFKKAGLQSAQKKIIWRRWRILISTTEYNIFQNVIAKADLYYNYYFKI